jgi:hypothetical protein
MRFRIFYAPQVFSTWEKIFVLTEDGILYCQFLMNFEISFICKRNIDYLKFRAIDFSWGKGVIGSNGVAFSNYQECKNELSFNQYKLLEPSERLARYSSINIVNQIRWVESYISEKGISINDWDGRFI